MSAGNGIVATGHGKFRHETVNLHGRFGRKVRLGEQRFVESVGAGPTGGGDSGREYGKSLCHVAASLQPVPADGRNPRIEPKVYRTGPLRGKAKVVRALVSEWGTPGRVVQVCRL